MENIQSLKQNQCILHWTGSNCSVNAPKVITANGNVTQILPFPGAGIGMFDGTGDYLTTTDDFTQHFVITSSTWTIESWFYCGVTSANYGSFAGQRVDANNWWNAFYDAVNSRLRFVIFISGAYAADYYCSFSPTLGSLNYVSFERSGSSFYIYVNGVAQTLTTNQAFTAAVWSAPTPLTISTYPTGGTMMLGGLSEYRISNVMRHTGTYTQPRTQLQSDSNTKLLLHFLGSGQTFVDSSPSPKSITAYGDAKQLSSPCNSGIAYFDGNGDYLSYTAETTITGDITVEGWIQLPSLSVGSTLWSTNLKTVNYQYFALMFDPTNGLYVDYTDPAVWGGVAPVRIYQGSANGWAINTWYHICFIRSGNNGYIFRNGVLLNSGSATALPATFTLGRVGIIDGKTGFTYPMNGYMADVRVSNIVRYNVAGFTPSIQPFKPDPYTKLLLHFDGVGQAFYDASDVPGDNGFLILPDGVTVTPNGTFTSIRGKDGRSYYKFDGSTNYITLSDSDAWWMDKLDFTLAFWFKLGATPGSIVGILGQKPESGANANTGIAITVSTANQMSVSYLGSDNSTIAYLLKSGLIVGQWYFITVVSKNLVRSLYFDSVFVTSNTDTLGLYNSTLGFVIGDTGYYSPANCNIKDLIIFKGKALTQDQIAQLMDETFIY